MAKKDCKANGGAVGKKRGGALAFDSVKAKSSIKKSHGGGVGSDKSPFSSAGGGNASNKPFSSAHRG
jgi:hypothetical protein